MQRVIKAGVLGAALGVLFSCSYDPQLVDDSEVVLHEIDAVRKMAPQGPAFNQGLRQGYLDYTDVMTTEYDYSDYWHFAFKAVDSAKGDAVLPDTVESRQLPPDNVEELSAARARLMAALDQTGRKKAPWQAAKAQTAFDCWLERAEENDPPEQIKVCKGEFESALAEVEMRAPSVPLVANVRAAAVTDPDEIRRLLVEQVTGTVRWRASVAWMAAQGVTEVVEIGAGKALSGMAKRIDRGLNTVAVNGPEDVKKLAEAVAG